MKNQTKQQNTNDTVEFNNMFKFIVIHYPNDSHDDQLQLTHYLFEDSKGYKFNA